MGKKNGPDRTPIADRFWRHVEKGEGCWLWTGFCTPTGYGKTSVERRPAYAHRVSWELRYGPIPRGLYVCHSCDNPSCVRPDHLFVATQRENLRDMSLKGRGSRYNALRTHCVNGHEFSPENTALRKSRKGRRCRICMREGSARRYAAWYATHEHRPVGRPPAVIG